MEEVLLVKLKSCKNCIEEVPQATHVDMLSSRPLLLLQSRLPVIRILLQLIAQQLLLKISQERAKGSIRTISEMVSFVSILSE